jgi:transcriptional regulator with XRE-family HTH domain
MNKLDPRYKQFLAALQYVAKNNWYRQIGVLAQESMISQGYLSGIINGKKQASYDKQVAIAKASGYDHESFLQLGHDLIQQENGSTPTTKHRSIKHTDTEPCKEDAVQMDQDVMKILQDHIETLKQNNERERQEHRDAMERERQAHERAMAELREDYRELKVENKELRNQLLEQHRALQKKKAQPRQSPDKPEEKQAVNQ